MSGCFAVLVHHFKEITSRQLFYLCTHLRRVTMIMTLINQTRNYWQTLCLMFRESKKYRRTPLPVCYFTLNKTLLRNPLNKQSVKSSFTVAFSVWPVFRTDLYRKHSHSPFKKPTNLTIFESKFSIVFFFFFFWAWNNAMSSHRQLNSLLHINLIWHWKTKSHW